MQEYPLVHTDDIGDKVGEFFGSPIREWDKNNTELRSIEDVARLISEGLASPSTLPVPEDICKHYDDEFIGRGLVGVSINRRKTFEADLDQHKQYSVEETSMAMAKLALDDGEMVIWRPKSMRNSAYVVKGIQENND